MPATPDRQGLLDTLAGLAKETNVSWEVLSSALPQPAKATARDAAGDDSTVATTTPAPSASSADSGTDTGAGASGSATSGASPSFAFDATVSGDDASVSAFLERVRAIERLVLVDKVQLSWNKSASGAGGGVSARLSMRAFIWKGASKATSTSTTVPPSGVAKSGDKAAAAVSTVATTVAS
jgi:hypothetical protein